MASNASKMKNAVFLFVFLVLTVLCWSPVGYGSYGEVGLIMSMPSWAFILLLIGAVLFVIEWGFLFFSDLALYDEDLQPIMDELLKINPQETVKEGK